MTYTNCWLTYPLLADESGKTLTVSSDFSGTAALEELMMAFSGLYRREVCVSSGNAALTLRKNSEIAREGYRITAENGSCTIESADERGALYGVFALIRQLRLENGSFEALSWKTEAAPANPMRMLNHWDNMDGSIERGYSGKSFFFADDEVLVTERTRDYARLTASVGINAVVINNVNVVKAASWLISHRYYEKLRRMQQIFAHYGIDLYLSVNFAAPMELGGLTLCDPCDEGVKQWWVEKAKEIWENLPGFGGFLVKADSEGRPGPFTYGRTHADGANMLADAVAPYGGRIIWRCFVYNCRQDWRDRKTDRAKAAYDNFMPVDGQFRDNVILQIKNGPMDFQVREPVAPLFGGLKKTNMMIEFQIAQEYTGQQRHVCYLMPWFRQVLDQDMHVQGVPSRICDLVSGRSYGNTNCGMAAVANTGNDINWTGHDLAAANWYGFGRLAYDMTLDPEAIAAEWVKLTFGLDAKVVQTLVGILMDSWPAYEKYTSPLGIGWMVSPNNHYGPSPEGYEYDRWGTYHRADHLGVGVERGSTGTGYCQQYNEPLASLYENVDTCPDELALFFHYLPYTHVLKSGKTVIQHIYDTHFAGAEMAAGFLDALESIRELLPEDAYDRMHERLTHQAEHACDWRDIINSYFFRKSGIPDEKGRTIY